MSKHQELEPVVGVEPTTYGLRNLFRWFARSWPQLGILGLIVEYECVAFEFKRRSTDLNALSGAEIRPHSSQNRVVKAHTLRKNRRAVPLAPQASRLRIWRSLSAWAELELSSSVRASKYRAKQSPTAAGQPKPSLARGLAEQTAADGGVNDSHSSL